MRGCGPGHSSPGTDDDLCRPAAYSQTKRISHRKGQDCCRYTIGPSVVLEATCSDPACVVSVCRTFPALTRPLLDRSVPEKDEFGNVKTKIKCVLQTTFSGVRSRLSRPFIIDLESTNSTYINDGAIPTSRYYELRASDGAFAFSRPHDFHVNHVHFAVIRFGDSPREYVLLHDEAS